MDLAAKAADPQTRQAMMDHYLQKNATHVGLPDVPAWKKVQ